MRQEQTRQTPHTPESGTPAAGTFSPATGTRTGVEPDDGENAQPGDNAGTVRQTPNVTGRAGRHPRVSGTEGDEG
jgi:hypothetical protein